MCLSLKTAAYEHFRELALLRRVRDRIDRERTLDLEALARSVDMTADQLGRRFRDAYGCFPQDYHRTSRAIRNREAPAAEPAVA